jgi:hypothetical protein
MGKLNAPKKKPDLSTMSDVFAAFNGGFFISRKHHKNIIWI